MRTERYVYMVCPTCGAKGKLGYPPKGGDGSALRIVPHRERGKPPKHTCPAGNTLVNRSRPEDD